MMDQREDPIKFLANLKRFILQKEEIAREDIISLRKKGIFDKESLDEYSRLLKAKEWVKGEMEYRYFAMEGARLVLAELLNIEAGMKVLDLGSGDGWFSIQAGLKHPNAEFYGIELSEEFAEAKEYAKVFDLKNTNFYYFDAYELPFPNGSFDRLALFFSLGNIALTKQNLERLFSECKRILKENGLIGIAEPFVEDFPGDMGLILNEIYRYCKDEEERLLFLKDVEETLKNGFKIRTIKRIKLEESGVPLEKSEEYLERYYERRIPRELLEKVKSISKRAWVRDDPPSYHIIVAERIS